MNCPHCGSTAVQPSGLCSACGRSVNSPAAPASTQDDPTALHYPPAVDPFDTAAPLTGSDGLAPYAPPAEPYSDHPYSDHPYSARPTSAQPSPGGPTSSGPAPAPPYPGQQPPAQPYPGQPTPSQPYGSQPLFGSQPSYGSQPYPDQPQSQPGQSYPGQPYPPQGYTGQQAPLPSQPPYYAANPYAPRQSAAQGFSITAFVLAAIAVFFIPIVFGLAAIVFAAAARRRGERYAQLAMRLAAAGLLLGIFFGYVFRASF